MPETIAVVEELHAQGRRVVLAGLCAGAWAALQTAVCVPVDGVVAINVQIYWKPGDPVDALITTTIERRARDRERETRGQRSGGMDGA